MVPVAPQRLLRSNSKPTLQGHLPRSKASFQEETPRPRSKVRHGPPKLATSLTLLPSRQRPTWRRPRASSIPTRRILRPRPNMQRRTVSRRSTNLTLPLRRRLLRPRAASPAGSVASKVMESRRGRKMELRIIGMGDKLSVYYQYLIEIFTNSQCTPAGCQVHLNPHHLLHLS